LVTYIRTIYQQHQNRFCLSYSLASALFYCGFKEAAENLASQAKFFACMHFDEQITGIRNLMLNLVPEIGQPTLYGIKRHNHKKDKAYSSETWFGNIFRINKQLRDIFCMNRYTHEPILATAHVYI
ncbi:MAG: hypothetical protein ACK515_29485, partial [bacterium]